jgi:hypothetical protein
MTDEKTVVSCGDPEFFWKGLILKKMFQNDIDCSIKYDIIFL